jgi:hypothetical protein
MTQKMQLISVTEYAKQHGKTRQWVLQLILQSKQLPQIDSYQKVGSTWVLIRKINI